MASGDNGQSSSKKAKVDDEESLPPLDAFRLAEVLGNDIERKCAFLHLRERKEGDGTNDAVVILDRKPFSDEDFRAVLDPSATKLTRLLQNDVYGGYEIELPAKNNAVKSTIIYPATRKHVEKYRFVESVMVSETGSDYERITLPHILQSQFSTRWVENVLNGTAEQERVFCDDPLFVMAPDLKWDGKRLENLYVTAIARQRGIKSIRDLDASHLPLLKAILERGKAAVVSKYNVPASRLRIFVHYQPSYYHFHVHFVHVMREPVGSAVGKAHLLEDIIDNIELIPDYYRRKTLYYALKTNDPLLAKLQLAKDV